MQATQGGHTSRNGVGNSSRRTTPPTYGPSTPSAPTTTLSPDELIRREFYATYDVMTGIRIAATLGGFFGLVVILVVYKSKSKTEKALNDPYLAAVAAEAVAETEADIHEEELAIQAAFDGTWAINPRSERTARQSLGNFSAPSTMWARSPRFSSVGGGYANLLTPPIRTPHKSLPGSALRFQPTNEDDDGFDEFDDFQFLNVNKRNYRRSSNITCSSSDSSYLERRGSAVVGLPPPPALASNRRRSSAEKCWDFYYPIDIQVIQPTPDMSPSNSERCMLYDTVPQAGLVVPSRLAPLATISSCASSVLGNELDNDNFGSDSVFVDNNYDTDDEITNFSTDSEEESLIVDSCPVKHSWKRRSSAPVRKTKFIKNAVLPTRSTENIQLQATRSAMNKIDIEPKFQRPQCPLPISGSDDTTTLIATATCVSEGGGTCSLNMPTMQMMERIPPKYKLSKSSSLVNIEIGTSQETLF